LVAAVILVLVAWNVTAKRAAEAQQQARGALQIELGDKLGKLLINDRRITYASVKFDYVPDAPRILLHYTGLKDWRSKTNGGPRALHGDLVLNFEPPDFWRVAGAGDLAEINTSFQTAAHGYVWWANAQANSQPVETTKSSMDSGSTPKFTFGPMIEPLFTNSLVHGFNSGVIGSEVPKKLISDFNWMRRERLDFAYLKNQGFYCVDLKLRDLTTENWPQITPSQLVTLLSGPGLGPIEGRLKLNANGITIYGFQTREGTVGIMEIIDHTNDLPVVKLRYKLVQQKENVSVEKENQLLAEQPPVVVETFPVSGARDVAPGDVEIRVRFSKPMTDGSWSWSSAWENSAPDLLGEPHYLEDHCTCVLTARLEPGRHYGWWLNSQNFQNFKDHAGTPAVPYLLTFETTSK